MADVGYYTLPVILSFDGIDRQVNGSLGKSLGSAGAKGGKDFAKQFAGNAEAGIKRLGDTYSKQYDRMKDATGKLKAEEQKLQDLRDKGVSGGRLVAQTERAEKARRDEARAVKAAADSYKDLEDAQKKVDNAGGGGGFLGKLKEAAAGAGSAGSEAASGFLEGFGGPIAELGSKAGPIGAALAAAAALALGAGGLIATQVMAGIEQEAQADKIQATFGFDDATMAKIADASGKAYAENFGESVSGNMSGAATAIQNGLVAATASDDQIKGTVEQLSTVSTVLGVEIPEAARSAGQLMRTGFAKDFTDAANLIVAGSQSGLNISEDWLDTVNEYSTQFRKLGITGPEALGLLSQAVKGGARDTDVAADALKEFSIRAIDGSKSTMGAFHTLGLDFDATTDAFAKGGPAAHDMFAQVLTGIQSIKDPYEKAQVQVALFGTQSEDLGEALNKFDLSTATQQLGNVEGAAQRASDTLGGNTANSIESAKRNIEVAVDKLQVGLADAFGPQIEKLTTYVTAHQDDILAFFSAVTGAATEFGAGMAFVIGGAVQAWGVFISAIGDGVGFVIDGFEQLVGGLATVAHAVGADGLGDALDSAKSQLGTLSDGLHSFGEDTTALGGKIVNAANDLHNFDTSVGNAATSASGAAGQIATLGTAIEGLDNKQIKIGANVTIRDQAGNPLTAPQLFSIGSGGSFGGGAPAGGNLNIGPGHAAGGPIRGAGGPTADLVPFMGSNGEHVWTAAEVNAVGGQGAMYRMRAMARAGAVGRFAGGGAIGIDALYAEAQALMGTKYSMASGDDCSGTMSQLINAALGLSPKTDRMSTGTAAQWLAKKGALPGVGPPGTFSVGWKNGGPGGGHMAGTLPDGTHVEMGGANGGYTLGGNAKGATDPEFTDHAYLPFDALYPDGMGASSGANPYGSSSASGTSGVGPNGESGTYSAPDAKTVREANQKVVDADQRVAEAEAKLKELKGDAKDSEKLSAQADVDKAKREAADARADAADAAKGKFTPGKAGKGGSGDLSEIGSIFGSFLKETTGLDGSLFPDIGNLMPVQMLGTLLGAFGGGDVAQVPGGGAFGMPNIGAPAAPGTAASGAGFGPLPGPGNNVTIDQSIHGNVGESFDDVQKKRDAGLSRALPRIPAGS